MKPKRTDELTDQEKKILAPYVSDVESRVFVLKNLNPEVIGAALARYSRAPTGLKETVAREFLNADGSPNEVKGTELIDRVVNKFGDESVAELAVAPLCIEDTSNLMTKIIQDCRIGGSPIEESTRYVLYDEKKAGRWRYVQPQNIMQSGLRDQYVSTMDFLFETYAGLVEPMKALFQKRLPKEKFEIEVERNGHVEKASLSQLQDEGEQRAHRIAYGFTIRSAACDVIRCILPASTTANMGLVANGRFYTQLISKLLSTNLDETQLLAEDIQKALNTQIPTFIKRAEKKSYRIETRQKMKDLCSILFKDMPIEKSAEVVLLPEDKAEDSRLHLLASMVFPYVQHSTEQIRQVIRSLPEESGRKFLPLILASGRASGIGRAGLWNMATRFNLMWWRDSLNIVICNAIECSRNNGRTWACCWDIPFPQKFSKSARRQSCRNVSSGRKICTQN